MTTEKEVIISAKGLKKSFPIGETGQTILKIWILIFTGATSP